MQREIILNIKELSVAFDSQEKEIEAVDRVSFELKKGAALGLVGESGCGKSVTALSIMGLLPKPFGRITHGTIMFGSENILDCSPGEMAGIRGRKIAMIFQEPMTALNPVHSIGKQIKEIYTLHFKDMTQKQIIHSSIEMLEKVGIAQPERILKQYPHQLSGGMRQRVMIAMALACKPDILIADEPTTALDVTVQAQILDLIKELKEKYSMSLLLITHDLGVIAENCDQAVVMYAGRIAEKSMVKELFKNPVHPYTRGLLDSIPSIAAITGQKRKAQLKTITGRVPSLANMPMGCRFSPRCPGKMDICTHQIPGEIQYSKSHYVSCHLVKNGEFHGIDS